MKIEILGTPFNAIGIPPNVENPADGLRQANLKALLQSKGNSVNDLGNLTGFLFQGIRDTETGISDLEQWIDLSNILAKTLREILARRSFALLLGGDCSMLVGVCAAFARMNTRVGLVFLDGHADFHSPETSPQGDPADMELAVLVGRGPQKITGIAGKYPLINEEDILVYGIRAWDQIAESDIPVYDRQQMSDLGVMRSVHQGLGPLVRKNLPLWVHFDVDVLDPELMPVMFPEPGGLTFEETEEFLKLVWASGRVIGISVACYHPNLDPDGSAGIRLATLISNVLAVHS
jgi:arginase